MSKPDFQITRRRFLYQASWAATGLVLTSWNWPQNSKLRFGLVTDSHYANADPKGTRYYRQALDKMEEFVTVMNGEDLDFVMHLGDFKDEDSGKAEQDTLAYLQEIEKVYAKFNGPRYHCVGNHDVDSISKDQFLSHITNTGIPQERSYYSFDHQEFHLVVLDANNHADGRDHFFKEGADWQDTNIGERQMVWLKDDLNKTSKPTMVFCHHPLYEYFREDFKFHVNQYQQVQQLFEESGKIVAVFQGHVHDENHQEINGIHYFTQYALVDFVGLDNNSFSLVEIDAESINVIGYKRVSNQKIKL